LINTVPALKAAKRSYTPSIETYVKNRDFERGHLR